MTAILDRRTAGGAAWCRRLAWFALVLMLTAVASHRFGFLATDAFFNVLMTVAAIAILSLAIGGRAFYRIWSEGDLGGGDLTVGVMLAALVLLPFAGAAYLALTRPALTDITSDLDDPPALAAATALRTAAMNPIEAPTIESITLQSVSYPEINGRRYDVPAEQVLDLVLARLADRGWPLTAQPPTAVGQPRLTVEALATTPVLALPADVAVRLTDEGVSTYVDMRSASRFGPHDLGENAMRIAAFLDALDEDVARQAGIAPKVE